MTKTGIYCIMIGEVFRENITFGYILREILLRVLLFLSWLRFVGFGEVLFCGIILVYFWHNFEFFKENSIVLIFVTTVSFIVDFRFGEKKFMKYKNIPWNLAM
jgi:hypothetical protein